MVLIPTAYNTNYINQLLWFKSSCVVLHLLMYYAGDNLLKENRGKRKSLIRIISVANIGT